MTQARRGTGVPSGRGTPPIPVAQTWFVFFAAGDICRKEPARCANPVTAKDKPIPFDISLLVFVVLVVAAASSGVLFKPGEWYKGLLKPSWTPPNWLFGPVWSVLYVMIAVAGWLVWRAEGTGVALSFWFLQLALNAVWSGIFFGLRRMDLAFYNIVHLPVKKQIQAVRVRL